MKVQEQLGAELQKEIKTMSEVEGELKKMYEKQSEELTQLEKELKDQLSHTEEKAQQLRESEVQKEVVEKQRDELEKTVQHVREEAEVKASFSIALFCILKILLHLKHFFSVFSFSSDATTESHCETHRSAAADFFSRRRGRH